MAMMINDGENMRCLSLCFFVLNIIFLTKVSACGAIRPKLVALFTSFSVSPKPIQLGAD